MDEERKLVLMVVFIKDGSNMEKKEIKEDKSIQMVICIQVTGEMTNMMDTVYLNMLME